MALSKSDKKKLVRGLLNSIRDDICKKIDEGKVPAEWNGVELRWIIADKVAFEAWTEVKGRRVPYGPASRRQVRDYRSAVYNNQL